MQNLLFHKFVLFKHENHVHNFHVQITQINIQYLSSNNMDKHMTFVFKQCA